MNPTILHDYDPVSVLDRRQAVDDHDGRPVLHDSLQPLLDLSFGGGILAGRSLG